MVTAYLNSGLQDPEPSCGDTGVLGLCAACGTVLGKLFWSQTTEADSSPNKNEGDFIRRRMLPIESRQRRNHQALQVRSRTTWAPGGQI